MQDFSLKVASQKGVSLIEILVATALGVVVILGVSQSLSNMVISSRLQEQNNDMQQTADMTLSYIDYRLRSALATPCASLDDINAAGDLQVNPFGSPGSLGNDINGNAVNRNRIIALINQGGIEVTNSTVSVGGNSTRTDNLITMSAGEKRIITNAAGTGVTSPSINISYGLSYKIQGNKKLFVISDCDHADVFVTSADISETTTTITPLSTSEFKTNYLSTASAMVAPLEVTQLSISNNGKLNDYPIFDVAGKQTLIDDVELLRILFGIDTTDDGKINRYISASQLTASDTVISAELYLLVRAPGGQINLAVRDYSVTLPNTGVNITNPTSPVTTETLNFNDGIMRKVFTRTVTFRNNASL